MHRLGVLRVQAAELDYMSARFRRWRVNDRYNISIMEYDKQPSRSQSNKLCRNIISCHTLIKPLTHSAD